MCIEILWFLWYDKKKVIPHRLLSQGVVALKWSKIRLPILIAASVVLCVIISVFSLVVIGSADRSMMEDKFNENKTSMQQTTAKVQKDITAKSDFIRSTAETLSQKESDFDELLKRHQKSLQTYADNGGFAAVLLSDTEGNAYSKEGEVGSIGDRDYFQIARSGRSGVSERVKPRIATDGAYAVVYYAPVSDAEGQLTAVLCGVSAAQMELSDYTDYAVNPYSGMYILNTKGDLVMSSASAGNGSFYDSVKDSKYADGSDGSYRLLETVAETASDGKAAGEDGSRAQTVKTTDYYTGDITDSQGFFGWLSRRQNTSSIYMKKPLKQNGWTLFYVRSFNLSQSTISFIILSRVLLFSIVLIFLVAMIVMLLLQWYSGKKITSLAYKDEITGRANWQKFVITSNNRLKNKSWWMSKHAALDININRFAIYNDYYGNRAGNSLLQYIAETLELMCSAKEISARRSADNFVVLWTYSDKQQLDERINDLFQLMKDGPNSQNVSLTVGVYLIDENDRDIVHAVDMANMAEQSVNDAKVNTVVYFDENLRTAMTQEHELEKLMQTALENDEFKLYLQPKHKVQGGALGGAEALVRWISPEKGFISPGMFIPLFEKNGFVGKVDNYILEQLCRFQQKRLQRGLKTVPISVNVSRVQLSDPHLAQEICGIVDKYGVPHQYIDLELTESACFDDMEVLVNTIVTLRSMGFPVSMDDFGSGYSSLNLLKELPFDTLKIDGEFFRHVTDLNRANLVVQNIIDLAKALKMTVVAEGIESEEQVAFLRTTECDLIQGYYYSKPISAKEFEDYMAKHRIEGH